MDFRELDADDEYDQCCGELFVTIKGAIVFHCSLCSLTSTAYEMFENHILNDHLTANEVYYNKMYGEYNIEYEKTNCLEESNLMKSSLDYNEKQNQHKMIKDATNQAHTDEPLEMLSGNQQDVSIMPKASSKSYLQRKRNASHKFPLCDRPNLKKNRSLSTALTDIDRIHKCPYCEFACKYKGILSHHVKRHSNNKPHKCQYCPKDFYTRTELMFHTRTHTGERPYLCDDCGKTFAKSQELKLHIKRHKNVRDFNCTECHKRFCSKPELKGHMTVHTKETPFKCDICKSVFTRRNALASHQKLHENKKIYQCQICDMAYNQSAGLYLHMKSKHKLIKN